MNPNREELLFRFGVDQACCETRRRGSTPNAASDEALRQRLEALLAAHEQPATCWPPRPKPPAQRSGSSSPMRPTKPWARRSVVTSCWRSVGEGGCGVVYIAEQTEPVRRRVALKVIKLGMDTKQVVARFEAERQALAMMDHPNIAKVLDAGSTEAGRPYFVMELVRGIKITDYCDQNHLGIRQRLDLFIQVCQAIQHAHQKGHHPSGHQAVEHPGDAARRRAGAQGD